MLRHLFLAIATLSLAAGDHGQGHGKGKRVPPGHAKKGGLPPGLAKKFGARIPERPYIAVDPRHPDRAYFLLDGRWVLKQGFSLSLQGELKEALKLPLAPPPVPLPKIGVDLHVVLFN